VDPYTFRGVDHIGQSLASDQLESSLITWLQWGLLGVGAFENVTRASLSPTLQGNRALSTLHPLRDPNFTDGTVWQGLRSDWVWESGIPYAPGQPIAVSGVYINSTFVPSTATGTYAHRIMYPEGRVLFDSPQPTGLQVQVEHTYRTVQVRSADQPWFQALVFQSQRADNPQWDAPPGSGGDWGILAQNRVQLPALVVEVVPRARLTPYEMGNVSQTLRQDVLVHVLTETPWERKRLHDILLAQKDVAVQTFDKNVVTFPLDAFGTPVAGALTYPQMCQQAPWRPARWVEASSEDQGDLGERCYWASVRGTFLVDVPS
jgi:hypothetical protein